MTDFNNLDTQIEKNTTGEESKIPSPEGVLEQKENFEEMEQNPPQNIPQTPAEPVFVQKTTATDQPNVVYQPVAIQYVPQSVKPVDPELEAEKKKIKRDALTIGSSFLLMHGIVLVLNLMMVSIGMVFGFTGNSKAVEILNSPAAVQVMQISFSLISFTFPFILFFKLFSVRISDIVSFSLPKRKLFLPLFLFGIAFCAFANIISSIAASFFEKSNIDYEVIMPENPKGIYGFLLVFISTVVVPALIEEFTCRGLVMGLLRKYGDGFAIVVSSILFGLMHGNFEQMPFAFMVGLVLGFITVKSGTLLIAIAVHAFNNFVSVAFDYFFENVPTVYQDVGYIIFLVVCLLLGIFALFLLKGEGEDFYKLERPEMKATDGKKALWFFTSATVIIYSSICLVESLQFFVI